MPRYARIADLPLRVDATDRERLASDTSSGFRRVTTVFELRGRGAVGRGEDVTYATEDHEALATAPALDLTGEFTFGEFSTRLDEVDLFPTKPPAEERFRHYRRWAVESAGLDLALRQADRRLGEVLDREYDPVRFVVSTRLPGADPSRVESLLASYPGLEFKLDPTAEWDAALIEALASTGAVRVLDLKSRYDDPDLAGEPDPELYARLFEAFPDAIVEDPALTAETEPIVRDHAERVSWDLPITGVGSIESLPFAPSWLNVKPSRFGTVESLLSTISYCEREGIACYGGGQFELGPGRDQIQALASLWYPDAPNDVAPRAFNEPTVRPDLPESPLPAPGPAFGRRDRRL